MAELRSEFLLRLSAELDDAQVVGDTPLGTRRILYAKRGAPAHPARPRHGDRGIRREMSNAPF
jgi:hypothetical protein